MNGKYLDELMEYFLSQGYPMAQLNVWQNHREIYHGCFGYADLENELPPREDTLYFFYSCTKPVTCAAALTLLERGKLLLSDPVCRYLPEYEKMNVAEKAEDGTVTVRPAARKMTVHDLFTMTAGFDYNIASPSIRRAVEETGGRAPTREVIRALAEEPLKFDPGASWLYSLCHDVLAALVEVVAGESFGDYVRRVIFDPLEMEEAAFHWSGDFSRFAAQYRFKPGFTGLENVGKRNGYMIGSEYESGGAGLITTVNEYMKFADAMAMGGVGANGARILKTATVDLMRSDALTETQRKRFISFNPNRIGYSYGLGVRTLVDRAAAGTLAPVGEFGWNGAAGMRAMFDPTTGVSFLFSQHTLNPNKVALLELCRNAVFGSLEN